MQFPRVMGGFLAHNRFGIIRERIWHLKELFADQMNITGHLYARVIELASLLVGIHSSIIRLRADDG